MNDNKKIEKLGDNGYYKPNLKENDADEGSNENAKDDAQQGQSYGRDSNLYSEKLLKRQLRQHFITIPQTTQDLNEIHENLISVSKNVKYILTAQEQHEDGGKHYHIVITGTKALYVSSIHKKIMEAEGDIKGSIDYQKVKTLKASITYCKKDGKYLEYGTPAKQMKAGRAVGKNHVQTVGALLDKPTTHSLKYQPTALLWHRSYITRTTLRNIVPVYNRKPNIYHGCQQGARKGTRGYFTTAGLVPNYI